MNDKVAQLPARPGTIGSPGVSNLSDLLRPRAPRVVHTVVHTPMALDLSLIDEDPEQPREANNPGFALSEIEKLAASIKERGVKTPISVRPHPSVPGRYMINHGARRFRASRIAGLQSMPAFIDDDYTDVDQVSENIQRSNLSGREEANAVGRWLAKGMSQSEIANKLGMSNAWVSQRVVLLDLPDPIAAAYTAGRVTDVTLINDLVRVHRAHTAEVEKWLKDKRQEITRGELKKLREFLAASNNPDASTDGVPELDSAPAERVAKPAASEKRADGLVGVGVRLADTEGKALAHFIRQLGPDARRAHSRSGAQAKQLQAAIAKLQHALAKAGFAD